jgi:hypothetical protein
MAPTRRYLHYHRLEPGHPEEDLARGFRAEVHDPLWMLGRQWQMGEHQGEDASSPVRVTYQASHQPVRDPYSGFDPTVTPAEAIVECEPDDWWTPGRRIRMGLEVSRAAGLPPVSVSPPDHAEKTDTHPPKVPGAPPDGGGKVDSGPSRIPDAPVDERRVLRHYLLDDLPAPYHRFNGQGYDGWKLFQGRRALGLERGLFAAVPAAAARDFWDPARFWYETSFDCADRTLSLPRHSGGHVDWYSVDADRPMPTPKAVEPRQVFPTRLRYPGSPHPRWWQIEDARVDIGGFPPDRSHFATMLLIDLIVRHSDDWFIFPVNTMAGHVVTLHEVMVRDSFDDEWRVVPPGVTLADLEETGDGKPPVVPPDSDLYGRPWSLFAVRGLELSSLLVWSTAILPLPGPPLEEVMIGLDEYSNLLWAVERRLEGRDLPTPPRPASPEGGDAGSPVSTLATKEYDYRLSTGARAHWHPYVIDADGAGRRWYVQGRLADLSGEEAVLLAPAQAKVLRNLDATTDAPVHQIDPSSVSSHGLRLERRYMLARDTNGQPVLWVQRRRLPLLAQPMLPLRFDVLRERAQS